MWGIDDTWVLLGYLLSIGSAVLCVVYGLAAWNRGRDEIGSEDVRWAAEEKKVEQQF
ncbi:MAG: hypothetical protein JXL80_11610 [Planctomycetes bacterium]|nr:hypothetical protein [Planctomycetota bacterium]